MSIVFVDDKKEKHQSHEAHLDLEFFEGMHNSSLSATGYGSTKEESLHNLSLALEALIFKVNKDLKASRQVKTIKLPPLGEAWWEAEKEIGRSK